MKKLGNLNLNPKKVLNTEEMINIKGGDDIYWCEWLMECIDPLAGQGYGQSCDNACERLMQQQYHAYNITCYPGGCTCNWKC